MFYMILLLINILLSLFQTNNKFNFKGEFYKLKNC